jgi:hypothetical protein
MSLEPPNSSSSFAFFLKCNRWRQASLARRHFFVCFLFFSGVADDGEPPRLVVISLFFFLGVAHDGEPGGSSSFLSFFLRCKRWQWAKQACRHLLHLNKKTRVKKKQIKKKVDVHLLATDALVIFWSSIFYNTTLATSSTTLLQHQFCSIVSTRLCNIVFYNNISTLLL